MTLIGVFVQAVQELLAVGDPMLNTPVLAAREASPLSQDANANAALLMSQWVHSYRPRDAIAENKSRTVYSLTQRRKEKK